MSNELTSALDGPEHGNTHHLLQNEIEVLKEEIEVLEEEIEAEGRHPNHPQAHVVIDNSDNGETIRMRVAFTVTIEKVIEYMYREFHLSHESGDRLTRSDTGQDVFAHQQETVREYVHDQTGSPHIHWIFAGDTGGAEA